jgi:hypothetical protein
LRRHDGRGRFIARPSGLVIGAQQQERGNGSQEQPTAQERQPAGRVRLVCRKVVRRGLVVVVVVTGVGFRSRIVMAMAAHDPAYLAVFPAKQV